MVMVVTGEVAAAYPFENMHEAGTLASRGSGSSAARKSPTSLLTQEMMSTTLFPPPLPITSESRGAQPREQETAQRGSSDVFSSSINQKAIKPVHSNHSLGAVVKMAPCSQHQLMCSHRESADLNFNTLHRQQNSADLAATDQSSEDSQSPHLQATRSRSMSPLVASTAAPNNGQAKMTDAMDSQILNNLFPATASQRTQDSINMRTPESILSMQDLFTSLSVGDMSGDCESLQTSVSDAPLNRRSTSCNTLNTPPSTLPNAEAGGDLPDDPLSLPPAAAASARIAANRGEISAGNSLATNNSLATESSCSVERNKPVWYSAIGSLEHSYNNNSYKLQQHQQFRKRASRFDYHSTQPVLPPKAAYRTLLNTMSAAAATAQSNGASASSTPKKGSKRPEEPEIEVVTAKESQPPTSDTSVVLKVNDITAKSKSLHKTLANKGKSKKKKRREEIFRPCSDAHTPRLGKKNLKFKPPVQRVAQTSASGLGTLQQPNFRDALKRVAMILHRHINKIERRFLATVEQKQRDKLFDRAKEDEFSEARYATPRFKCSMVRLPMARPGMVYGLKKTHQEYEIPTTTEIYDFACQLFDTVQLSSECSIVCLIYVERIMEASKVPLLATTWRPLFMSGLLLASKVWQDLSSWNVEFASVYPQYSVDAINRLELAFLKNIRWNLYISSTDYAKYYFALRSLLEKSDFRQRYNRLIMGSQESEPPVAKKVQERTALVKEEAMQLSQSCI